MILSEINSHIAGQLTVKNLSWLPPNTIVAKDLAIVDPDGKPVALAKYLKASLEVSALADRTLHISTAQVRGLKLNLLADDSGLNIARAFASVSKTESQDAPLRVVVGQAVAKSASVLFRKGDLAVAIADLSASAGLTFADGKLSLTSPIKASRIAVQVGDISFRVDDVVSENVVVDDQGVSTSRIRFQVEQRSSHINGRVQWGQGASYLLAGVVVLPANYWPEGLTKPDIQTGDSTVFLQMTGPLEKPRLVLDLQPTSLEVAGTRLQQVGGKLELNTKRLQINELKGDVAGGRFKTNGKLTFASSTLQAKVRLQGALLEELARTQAIGGRLTGDAEINGTVREPLALDFSFSGPVQNFATKGVALKTAHKVSADGQLTKESIRFDAIKLTGAAISAQLRGRVGLDPGLLDLTIRGEAHPSRILRDLPADLLFDPVWIQGTVSGVFRLARFRGQLRTKAARYRTVAASGVVMHIDASSKQVAVSQLVGYFAGGLLEAAGGIDLKENSALSGTVRISQANLSHISDQAATGLLDASAVLDGTLAEPQVLLALRGQQVIYAGAGPYELLGEARLLDDKVVIDQLHILPPGELQTPLVLATGNYSLKTSTVAGRVQVQPIAVDQLPYGRRLRLSGQLAGELLLEGPLDALEVRGQIGVKALTTAGVALGSGSAAICLQKQVLQTKVWVGKNIAAPMSEVLQEETGEEPEEEPEREPVESGDSTATDSSGDAATRTVATATDQQPSATVQANSPLFGVVLADTPCPEPAHDSAGTRLLAAMVYRLQDRNLHTNVTLRDISLAAVTNQVSTLQGIDGVVQARFRGDGPVDQFVGQGVLRVVGISVDGKQVGSAALAAKVNSGVVVFKTRVLQQIEGKGKIDLRGGQQRADASLVISGLAPEYFVPGLRAQKATGSLDGTVQLYYDSSMDYPLWLDSALRSAELEIAPAQPLRLVRPTTVNLAGGLVTVAQTELESGGSKVTLGGTVAEDQLNFDIAGEIALPLVRLLTTEISAAQGFCTAELSLRGQLRQPQVRGRLTPQPGASLTPRSVGSPVVFRSGRLDFSAAQVRAHNLHASGLGGDVWLDGAVALTDGAIDRFDLKARVEHLLLRMDRLRAEVNSDLTLVGPLQTAQLAGEVEIVEGRFFERYRLRNFIATASSDSASVALADRLPKLAGMLLDVRISGGDLRADADMGSMALNLMGSTDLRLGGSLRDPSLVGVVEVSDGLVAFLNSNLEVESATIDFPPRPDRRLVPRIDLIARSLLEPVSPEASELPIVLTISGDIEQMKLDIEAEDSAQRFSRAELISMLATGRYADDLLGQTSGDAALRMVSRELTGEFERRVETELDRLVGDSGAFRLVLESGTTSGRAQLRWDIGSRFQIEGETTVSYFDEGMEADQEGDTSNSVSAGTLRSAVRARWLIVDHLPLVDSLALEADLSDLSEAENVYSNVDLELRMRIFDM